MPSEYGRVQLLGLRLRREVVALQLAALLVFLAVIGGAVVASRAVARAEALRDAEGITERLARLVIAPQWAEATRYPLGVGSPMDADLRYRISTGEDIEEINVYASDGTVVYSTTKALRGQRPEVLPEIAMALKGEPTSHFERHVPPDGGPVLENVVDIDVPLDAPGYPRMALEVFFNYESVTQSSRTLLRSLLPLALLPLVVLMLLQVPIMRSLFRQLRRHEADRAELLEESLEIADRERAEFAADLHDGPLQDLAGVSYALGAIGPSVPAQYQPLMGRLSEGLQRSISSLRNLMTDLYPPSLLDGNLAEVVAEASQRLRASGVEVSADLAEVPELDPDALVVLYRTVREVLANVEKHARATHVTLTVRPVAKRLGRPEAVELLICDNGVGTAPDQLTRRTPGHLGLRLLRDRVERIGGQLTMGPRPGGGTEVQAFVPTRVQHS